MEGLISRRARIVCEAKRRGQLSCRIYTSKQAVGVEHQKERAYQDRVEVKGKIPRRRHIRYDIVNTPILPSLPSDRRVEQVRD